MGVNHRTNRTHIAHTHIHTRTKGNETMYKRKKQLQKISKIKAFCLLGKYERNKPK